MNTPEQKKDEDLSFWAKLFFMMITNQHRDFIRLGVDNEMMHDSLKEITVKMFSEIFSDETITQYDICNEYPGDEAMFGKDGPNKDNAEWNIFKIIIFKRVCEKIDRIITYQEFVMYFHLLTNHIVDDDMENCQSRWYYVIEMLGIPVEYIPVSLKSSIARSNEELMALKIIQKHVSRIDKIDGTKFTLESYRESTKHHMEALSRELEDNGMFEMANRDIAPDYAVAIRVGIMPPSVLYAMGNPMTNIPHESLKDILRTLWDQHIEGHGEFDGTIFNMAPMFAFGNLNEQPDGEEEGESGDGPDEDEEGD